MINIPVITPNRGLILCSFVCFLLGSVLAGGSVWKWQHDRYEAQTSKLRSNLNTALAQKVQEVFEKERDNARIVQQLEEEAISSRKERDSLLAANNSILHKYNSLRFHGSSCKPEAGASNGAPSSAIEGQAGAAECSLPKEASKFIVELANKADELQSYANTCEAYTRLIDEQRKRMLKEQEDSKN